MVLFSSTMSLLILCLLVLSITDTGMFKYPIIIVDSSLSPCCSISFCLMYFDAVNDFQELFLTLHLRILCSVQHMLPGPLKAASTVSGKPAQEGYSQVYTLIAMHGWPREPVPALSCPRSTSAFPLFRPILMCLKGTGPIIMA